MNLRIFALPSAWPLPLTALGLVALLAGCASTPPAPDATTLMAQAEKALGSATLKTLVVSGRGNGSTFGQAWQPGIAWPGLTYSTLTRSMNFDTGAYREEFARSRSEPNGGGATPLMGMGEARASGSVRDGFAWNTAGTTATPAGVALQGRQHDLWTSTPQGALKAARRYNAVAGTRVQAGQALHTLQYSAPGQLAATLVLDAQHLVTRIESTMPHPVLGDTPVITEFSDYQTAAGGEGLRFPMRVKQTTGGFPVLDWSITEVKADTAVDIAVPDNVRAARENATPEKVAEGVWFLAGGSHNSVAIELSNQIVLVESPLYDARSAAVFATANQLVPGKKVMTVINSHHHFDHAGGLRNAVAEGAQLITSTIAKPYFERVFANPNRIAPDRMALSGQSARITAAGPKTVMQDALRTIEILEMQGSVHSEGFLMVWLPKEKLLIQADAYTPGPPNSPPPPVPNANQVNLAQNIEQRGIQPERILPLHGRVVPIAELYTQIGRKP